MNIYPMFVDLTGKDVALIGGGMVAYRKAKNLVAAGAIVKIVSLDFCEPIRTLKNDHFDSVLLIERAYQYGDLGGACLVIAATGNAETNRAVAAEAGELHVFFNVVDDPELSSYYVPSVIRKGDLVVAVSTNGASPAMARKLRKEIEKTLPENVELFLQALRHMRKILQENVMFGEVTSQQRGEILTAIVGSDELLMKMVTAYANSKELDFLQNVYNIILSGDMHSR